MAILPDLKQGFEKAIAEMKYRHFDYNPLTNVVEDAGDFVVSDSRHNPDNTPETPSGLLRKGATMHKQAFRCIYDYDLENEQVVASCALGAIYFAKFGRPADDSDDAVKALSALFAPDNRKIIVVDPTTDQRASLFNTIISLNDNYEWSREKIADWLESQGL